MKALKDAGFSIQESVLVRKSSREELRDAGYSAWGLRACGFTLHELHHAGYSEKMLADAGFQWTEALKTHLNALPTARSSLSR